MSALPRVVYLDSTEVEVEKAELNGLAQALLCSCTGASCASAMQVAGCQVSCYSAKTVADIPDDVAEAAVVGVWHTIWLDAALLSRLKSAKCIVRMGVGYDNVCMRENPCTHAVAHVTLHAGRCQDGRRAWHPGVQHS